MRPGGRQIKLLVSANQAANPYAHHLLEPFHIYPYVHAEQHAYRMDQFGRSRFPLWEENSADAMFRSLWEVKVVAKNVSFCQI